MGRLLFCLACVFGGATMAALGMTLMSMVVQSPVAWAWYLGSSLFSLAGLAICFMPLAIAKLEQW